MLFTEFNMDDALDVRYEEGVEDGRTAGLAFGIQALISTCKEFGVSYESTFERVKNVFDLDNTAIEQNMNLYW